MSSYDPSSDAATLQRKLWEMLTTTRNTFVDELLIQMDKPILELRVSIYDLFNAMTNHVV